MGDAPDNNAAPGGEVRLTEHNDHLLIEVIGRLQHEQLRAETQKAARLIRQEGKRWNIITDFSHAILADRQSNRVLSEYSKGNRPYVRKSAVVGLSGMKRFFFDIVVRASGRTDLRPFKTRQEALDWFQEE